MILFYPPNRKWRWLCLQNVLGTQLFLTTSVLPPWSKPPSSVTWITAYAPNWPPCRCPRLSVVCFQHNRSNDTFEIQISSGQKPTRAPYPFRVKSKVLTRGPQNQLLSSLTGTLVQVHPSPGLSVNLVEQSGPRTFALPVPLPPRYLHHLSSFFLQDFVQM